MISQQSIQMVSEIPPAQTIEYYTGQRPQHGKYLCPFHNDTHPSLTVKNGHWQCWACGEHGDAIHFIMKYRCIPFPEAVHKLADDFGIMLPEEKPPADPLQKLWQIIERECKERDRAELQAYRQSILSEINAMTDIHRAMLRSGASDEACKAYSARIDEMEARLESLCK